MGPVQRNPEMSIRCYYVITKGDNIIGDIRWYGSLSEWVFEPIMGVVYTTETLLAITIIINGLGPLESSSYAIAAPEEKKHDV